ncbi:MAG: gliding motility-associated C-terminal domain-containing protein [Bacteroidales bacterium]|nr:gliding motility-associated C-terminal domain-containing protein [Bacteroidales bacterium]
MTYYKGFSTSLFIGILFYLTVPVLAQSPRNCEYIRPHQADKWVFGNYGGIDFSTTPPQAIPTPDEYSVTNGVSTYSDENGVLKAFTNGMVVNNGGYGQMVNGDGLFGYSAATMSSIIIPNPGNSKQLFVITIDLYFYPRYINGVNYSIIDFSNNQNGEVINKNVLLFKENAQKVCAIQHENQRDYWVVLHGLGGNTGGNFYTYLIDTGGIQSNPIISQVGYHQNDGGGYMKASPDGTKIALAVYGDGVVELLDFNKSTGILSNPKTSVPGQIAGAFGIEFSPDNSKLYVTTAPLVTNFQTVTDFLYQFDLTSATPFAPPFTVIDQFDFNNSIVSSMDSLMGALQLSPDGKIFLSKVKTSAHTGKPTLSVIYNPNRAGTACNYNTLNHATQLFNLNGGESLTGLPNFVTDYLNIPHFSFFNKCHHDTTDFQIRNTANVDADWNFATIDPNGSLVYPDPLNPGFVFSDPGTYQVVLTETWNGVSIPDSCEVIIYPLPVIDIGNGSDTISILPNSSIRLDVGEWDYIEWSPGGSHDRYLDVNEQGKYYVTVVDTNCCYNIDSVYIQFAELSFPNAFRPSSSIIRNQEFGVIGDVSSLAKYIFQVYDRWGMLLFETKNPTEKWKGTFPGGEPAPQGVYVWHSVFTTFESSIEAARDIENRGTVMLLR